MIMLLQYRVFLYQAILLVAFVFLQLSVFAFIEYREWIDEPTAETMHEGLREVTGLIAMNALLIPLMLALVYSFSKRIMQPIRQIANTADRISGGQFEERIPTSSMPDDDTRHLAETLNHAFERYQDAVKRLQRFSGDAAHQIRTPIAAIRATGEVAISRKRNADEYRSTITDMLDQLHRLSLMTEQLLQLSSLEAGSLRERFSLFDTSELFESCMQTYLPLSEEAGVHLEPQIEPGIWINGIPSLLCECLSNLLDNAIRHTPSGGTIEIGLKRNTTHACFHVQDTGKGIPTEFAETIFERFTQIPGSSNGGAGLGLPLAADIAAVHGGKLTLANPGDPGARFEWEVPLPVNNEGHP